jgi:hypothetical protein
MTYFSKYLFNTEQNGAFITLSSDNLMFPNNQVSLYKDQLYSTWGTVKDFKVLSTPGPSF